MVQRWRLRLSPYTVSVLTTLVALALSLLLRNIMEHIPFVFFFGSLAVTSAYGGLGPGLLTVALSVVAVDFTFLAEQGQLFNPQTLIATGLFASVALLISSLYEGRKRAEALVRADRERLRITLISIGDAVMTTDQHGSVILMNPVAEDLTGWRQEEAVGRPLEQVFRIVHQTTREVVENPVAKVLREGRTAGLANHTVLLTKEGREVPIDDSGAPIRDETGTMVGVVLVFRDITARMRLEAEKNKLTDQVHQAALRAVRLQELTALLSGSVTPDDIARIFVPHATQAIQADGGTLVRLMDDAVLETIQTHQFDPDLVRQWQRFPLTTAMPLAEAVRTAAPIWVPSHEDWIRRYGSPPVSPQYQAWAALPLIANAKTIGGIAFAFLEAPTFDNECQTFVRALAAQCAQALDRTFVYEAQQQARQDAEAARQHLEFLLNASELLSRSLDCTITLPSLRQIIFPALADVYAVHVLDNQQMAHQVIAGAADPAVQERLREIAVQYRPDRKWTRLSPTLQSGKTLVLDQLSPTALEGAAADPDHLALLRQIGLTSQMTTPLKIRDQVLGMLTMGRTRPERPFDADEVTLIEDLALHVAQALENARLYAEAQQAIQIRDEFLSIAAHELRTPVTSLRGFAQTLLRQFEKRGVIDPAQLDRALHNIDMQSAKLSTLIGQLLDIARLEAGRLKVERQVTDLVALIQNVVGQMQEKTDQHTLQLSGPTVLQGWIDPLRFEQVVANLLDNAIKYSPGGGQIDVSLTTTGAHTARLCVADHGLGIPPERREFLFNRFYRAHQEDYFSGMGLGLYISRQIVELHEGHIRAEFPIEGGSRFIVELPLGFVQEPLAP